MNVSPENRTLIKMIKNEPPCGKSAGYLNTSKILFAVIPAKAGIQKKTIWIPHQACPQFDWGCRMTDKVTL
jgi:hypothetical protein